MAEDARRAKSYQLYIFLAEAAMIDVGGLGAFAFPRGWYIYTGSAVKSIEARVARHLSASKTIRWHVDYLLAHPQARAIGVELLDADECEANRGVSGRILVPRFGATDCRSGCGSHLKYLGEKLEP